MALPAVYAAAAGSTVDAPSFWLLLACSVLLVLVAGTAVVLWRVAERDMVDARQEQERWEGQHRDEVRRRIAAEAERDGLRWQLDQQVPVSQAWADGDRPDSLPTLMLQETGPQPVLDPVPRLWTGGQATVLVEPGPQPGGAVAAGLGLQGVPEPQPGGRVVESVVVAGSRPGPGLTDRQAATAARWHRQGRTWAQVGEALGVSASVASRAGKRSDPDC